jgi:hypothetical protein
MIDGGRAVEHRGYSDVRPQQYRKLMKQYPSENHIAQSAIKAGIDPKTAGKYLKGAPGPEEQAQAGESCWRTHPDAFAQVWAESKRCFFMSLNFRRG